MSLKRGMLKLEKDLYACFFKAYIGQYLASSIVPGNPQSAVPMTSISNCSLVNITTVAAIYAGILSTAFAAAIYKFVKEIGVNVPLVPPIIMYGTMPCTGSMPMTNFKIK